MFVHRVRVAVDDATANRTRGETAGRRGGNFQNYLNLYTGKRAVFFFVLTSQTTFVFIALNALESLTMHFGYTKKH